jgi:hypothetical protein
MRRTTNSLLATLAVLAMPVSASGQTSLFADLTTSAEATPVVLTTATGGRAPRRSAPRRSRSTPR